MDFDFNSDQNMFRDSFRRFLDKEIAPIVDERDKKGPLAREEAIGFMKKFKKIGVGWDPQSLKGFMQDFMTFGILTEELSRVWLSLDLVYTMNFGQTLLLLAPDAMREKLMPQWREGGLISCNAITEPNAGSDHRSMRTTAVLDGDKYIINGSKTWVSNAPIADICLLVAKDETGRESAFLIDREESPFQTRELLKLGLHAGPTGEMFFDECCIPRENNVMEMVSTAFSSGRREEIMEEFPLVTEMGLWKLFNVMSPVSAIFCFSRSWMALAAVGVCRAALEASIAYAKEREQFGRPIGKTQTIQGMIYEMMALTETSRLLSYRALDLTMKGSGEARLMSSLAKGYAAEAAVRVASSAIQIHGAMGLSVDLPLERYFRDARSWTIPDGTTEIQKLVVGNEALGMSAYV
ncbi:MAG: acyl-CoA/acyl-ACP dehydrogenase [Deltaproteobacteria bacterium]|nr:acyl-CoA/acyl-ACP dehydrogenase [Deltaproteobacteria bacterium]